MEIEETLLRLVDFLLFEKEWGDEVTGLHLAMIFDAIAEFGEIYDVDVKRT